MSAALTSFRKADATKFLLHLAVAVTKYFVILLRLVVMAGCLQLLEILQIYWNLQSLLEIPEILVNLIVPPGNFWIIGRRSIIDKNDIQ